MKKIPKSNMGIMGITLVEIILAIAIIGIIVVSLIPIFTQTYVQITRSGNRTNALYVSQEEIEKKLQGEAGGLATSTNHPITLKFGTTEIIVSGKVIEVKVEYDTAGNTTTIKSFKPD